MYLIGSQKKVLGYAITTNEPAITLPHPNLDGRLSLTLDGKTLHGIRSWAGYSETRHEGY
jgi:hypothetical protein